MAFQDLDELVDTLDDPEDYPDAWQPEPGDLLAGKLVKLDTRDGGYGEYPIVTVQTDEDGTKLAFHGYHSVFKSELEDQAPTPGDLIAIRYDGTNRGKSGNEYHAYTVKVKQQDDGDGMPW